MDKMQLLYKDRGKRDLSAYLESPSMTKMSQQGFVPLSLQSPHSQPELPDSVLSQHSQPELPDSLLSGQPELPNSLLTGDNLPTIHIPKLADLFGDTADHVQYLDR